MGKQKKIGLTKIGVNVIETAKIFSIFARSAQNAQRGGYLYFIIINRPYFRLFWDIFLGGSKPPHQKKIEISKIQDCCDENRTHFSPTLEGKSEAQRCKK